MPKRDTNTIQFDHQKMHHMDITTGKIKKNVQITIRDTGWSEDEKERMRKSGYDTVDMIRAWYG